MVKGESKSVRILDMIDVSGDTGMRFTEIPAALWSMTHAEPFTRVVRGYWCTNLLGGPEYHRGLLRHFAVKGSDGRWRRNYRPHCGKPWALVKFSAKPRGGW